MQNIEQALANEYTYLFARTLVGLVLLTAGLAKLFGGRKFVEVVRNYKLLPEALVAPVGRLIPFAEVFVAVLVFADLLQPFAALAAALLFLMFGGALAINLLRGRTHISCGCFGVSEEQRLSWALVWRNLLFAALAFLPQLARAAGVAPARLAPEEAALTILLAGAALASFLMLGVIVKNWDVAEGEPE